VALLTTFKQQHNNIAGSAEAAYHVAGGIHFVLRDAAAALRRNPIMHSAA